MVKVLAIPEQLTPEFVKIGVTTMFAVIGVDPTLIAVKDGIFPVPLAAIPIEGLSFVQL